MAIARNSPPAVPTSTSGEVATRAQSSIFRKAGAVGGSSTLVFGASSTGKSTWVRDQLVKANQNPLWIAFNNTAAVDDAEAGLDHWDVGTPPDWTMFKKGVLLPLLNGELTGYDALVLDGLDVLLQNSLASIVAEGKTPERSEWNIATNMVRNALLVMRNAIPTVYAILDVVADAQSGTRKLNLNPYAKTVLLPLFAHRVFTGVVRVRGADSRPTGEVKYVVQTNPALALEMVLPKD